MRAVVPGILVAFAVVLQAQPATMVKVRVTLIDADLNVKPVPRHALSLIPLSGDVSVRFVTNFEGQAEVPVLPGDYTLESDKGVAFHGRLYRWKQTVHVGGGSMLVELSSDNALYDDTSTEDGQTKVAAPAAGSPTGSSPTAPSSSAAPESEALATIYVYRLKRFSGFALGPSIFFDNEDVANLGNGRFLKLAAPSGKHIIRSNDQTVIPIDLAPGTVHYFRIDIVTGAWKGHGAISEVTAAQGEAEIAQLKRVSDEDVKSKLVVRH